MTMTNEIKRAIVNEMIELIEIMQNEMLYKEIEDYNLDFKVLHKKLNTIESMHKKTKCSKLSSKKF